MGRLLAVCGLLLVMAGSAEGGGGAPRIGALEPAAVDFCPADGASQLIIRGENFAAGARVLVGNATVAVADAQPDSLMLTLPTLPAGRYPVQVINPDAGASLPAALTVSDTPRIDDITARESEVLAYDLVIHGSNFHFDSRLLVDGRVVGPLSPAQLLPRESLRFIDCSTLIYRRYPTSGQNRLLRLRVVNPAGAVSIPYTLSSP